MMVLGLSVVCILLALIWIALLVLIDRCTALLAALREVRDPPKDYTTDLDLIRHQLLKIKILIAEKKGQSPPED